MKRVYMALLMLGLTFSAFSQGRMIVHKIDGSKSLFSLSTLDSVTYKTAMIQVAAGTFTAGSTEVTISGFNIDRYEVTYEYWNEVRNWALANGYLADDLAIGHNGYNPAGTHNPVIEVSWQDAVRWCNARSEKEGLTPVYYTDGAQTTVYRTTDIDINNDAVKWSANGYRLPTETEWEFAARGGISTKGYDYSGSSTIDDVAWSITTAGGTTHSTGSKLANEIGIYDMSGNAMEWCWDWYDTVYPAGGTTDPQGPSTSKTYRVVRGGSFESDTYCLVADRHFNVLPNDRGLSAVANGFRCVKK
jgi:formylglycine-generating enzyme